jgi:glycerophosphoryl diester phosphodiesterase
VALAGGAIDGKRRTNAREALDGSAAVGFRAIEVDLAWTSDEHLVVAPPWDDRFDRWFGPVEGPLTLEAFRALRMTDGLTQLTLDDLGVWLDEHAEVLLVLDPERPTVAALGLVAETCGRHLDRLIARIEHPSDYDEVRRLGFVNVILDLDRVVMTEYELRRFVARHAIYAVVIRVADERHRPFAAALDRAGAFVYAEPVNDADVAPDLEAEGFRGFFTDILRPSRDRP